MYFPWKRRIRKVDAREWAAREQFGMPVALAELFDVVCQSGVVATAQGGFIPMDRRTATMLSPGDMSLNGLIDSVQKLGCSASAGTAEAESPSAVVAD